MGGRLLVLVLVRRVAREAVTISASVIKDATATRHVARASGRTGVDMTWFGWRVPPHGRCPGDVAEVQRVLRHRAPSERRAMVTGTRMGETSARSGAQKPANSGSG